MDHFERLGLPRRFSIEKAELERQYLARSRAVHPDFFQAAGDLEQRASLDSSAGLNEAYSALSDPFRRADYLLQLEGGPTAAEMKSMPAVFLEEMLELRMEIEEIKQERDTDRFEDLAKRLAAQQSGLLAEIEKQYKSEMSDRQSRLREIRQLLNATKYVQGLIRDLHAD